MKVRPSAPHPIRYYREKKLEPIAAKCNNNNSRRNSAPAELNRSSATPLGSRTTIAQQASGSAIVVTAIYKTVASTFGNSMIQANADNEPTRLRQRSILRERCRLKPACFALQILAQASRTGTKSLCERCARCHVPNCFSVNNERTCR